MYSTAPALSTPTAIASIRPFLMFLMLYLPPPDLVLVFINEFPAVYSCKACPTYRLHAHVTTTAMPGSAPGQYWLMISRDIPLQLKPPQRLPRPSPQSHCTSTSTGSVPPVAAAAHDSSFIIGSGGGESFSN
ncbi:hypothetical protein Vafri_14796 [Volvox africanus]|uniref:Uncharacterized protein n=1 Tax=Volvox africanus TaxID=51714 RepID=A0A8J4BFB5_9CHLO|nr:hypothetical protein Vafri_14796 [Volvox africanus]